MARATLVWNQNLVVQSEGFSDAAWTKAHCSIAANAVPNPRDGAMTADALVDDGANDLHDIQATSFAGPPLGAWLTVSIYAKCAKPATPWLLVGLVGAFGGGGTYFNLMSGQRTDALGAGGFSEIELLPNGWARCSIAGPALQDVAASTVYLLPTTTAGVFNYLGDGTAAVYLWGAQATRTNGPVRYAPTSSTQLNPTAGLRLYAAGRSP